MQLSKIVIVAIGASYASAFSLVDYSNSAIKYIKRTPISLFARASGKGSGGGGGGENEGEGGSNSCPPVWGNIATELTSMYLDNSVRPSQCNDDARAAIREAFHDCGAWETSIGSIGGCDGSLILSQGNDELLRGENNGLQDISQKLLALYQRFVQTDPSITVADLIQFSSSVAIVTCPGGPQVKTWVGRRDSTVPAAHNLLPDVHAPGADLFALFQRKGFNAKELAALIGAHSTSKQFHIENAPVGAPQDSTPGIWDVKFYSDTLNPPPGVFVFPSDTSLSQTGDVGKEFKGFVNNQGKWTGDFAKAMEKMGLLGVPGGSKNLIDCTKFIPKGTSKRDIRAAPINDRVR